MHHALLEAKVIHCHAIEKFDLFFEHLSSEITHKRTGNSLWEDFGLFVLEGRWLILRVSYFNTPHWSILLIELKLRGHGSFVDNAGAEGCLRRASEVADSRTATFSVAIGAEHYFTITHRIFLWTVVKVKMIYWAILCSEAIHVDGKVLAFICWVLIGLFFFMILFLLQFASLWCGWKLVCDFKRQHKVRGNRKVRLWFQIVEESNWQWHIQRWLNIIFWYLFQQTSEYFSAMIFIVNVLHYYINKLSVGFVY